MLEEIKLRIQTLRAKFSANPQTVKLITILVIAAALPLTVIAALTVQDLRQQASEGGSVQILNTSTNSPITTTDNPNVALKITLPSDWVVNPAQGMKRDDENDGFIKKAHAQSCSEFVIPNKTCGQDTYANCTEICIGQDAGYHCEAPAPNDGICQGDIYCVTENSRRCAPTPTPIPQPTSPPQPTASTCNSLITISGKVQTQQGQGVPNAKVCLDPGTSNCTTLQATTDSNGNYTINNVIPGGSGHSVYLDTNSLPQGASVSSENYLLSNSCSNDTKNFTITVSDSQPTNIPPTTIPSLQPNPSESPIHVLQSITIQNVGSNQQPTPYSTNLQELLQDGIPWSLTPLTEGETQATRTIQITLSDGTITTTLTVNILLTRQQEQTITPSTTSNGKEFLVDVFVDNKFISVDHKTLGDWATNAVNNYTNQKFQHAGIKHKLKVDKVYKNVSLYDDTCPPGYQKEPGYVDCRLTKNDGKIRIWLYEQDRIPKGMRNGPQAFSSLATVNIVISPDIFVMSQKLETQILAHEIGHIFSLPDYYFEDVLSYQNNDNNHVVKLPIKSYIQDLMSFGGEEFSETSKEFINKVTSLPIGKSTTSFANQYTPSKTILKITDENGSPFNNVRVEVFQQEQLPNEIMIIPNTVKFIGITDQNGQFDLGNVDKLFSLTKNGTTALLRIMKDSQIRYMAITRSYLNYLYFQGQTETAIITKQFSSLATYDPNKTTVLSGDGTASIDNSLTPNARKIVDEQHLPEDQSTPTSQTYEDFQKCFKVDLNTNASCRAFDKNNDGKVDETDYRIFLQSL